MKGLLLFLIALISVSLVFVLSTTFSVIYYIVCFWKVKEAYKKIDKYFYDMAHSVDQFGNVNCSNLFNHVMISKKWRNSVDPKESDFHKFGDVDDTISYIIGDNWLFDKLSKFGNFWGKFLNFVDTDDKGTHLEKSIMAKYKQDLIALNRLTVKWKNPKYQDLIDRAHIDLA